MMLARYPLLIYSLFLFCPALFTFRRFRRKTIRGFVEVEVELAARLVRLLNVRLVNSLELFQ